MLVEKKKISLGREALKHGQQVCWEPADYTHTHPFALHLLSLQTQHILHFAMWLWVAQMPHAVPEIGNDGHKSLHSLPLVSHINLHQVK